jgi:hypothetical protein
MRPPTEWTMIGRYFLGSRELLLRPFADDGGASRPLRSSYVGYTLWQGLA